MRLVMLQNRRIKTIKRRTFLMNRMELKAFFKNEIKRALEKIKTQSYNFCNF
jgi:hypothetical protein